MSKVDRDALAVALDEAQALGGGTLPGVFGLMLREVAQKAIEAYCRELDEPRMGSSGSYDPPQREAQPASLRG